MIYDTIWYMILYDMLYDMIYGMVWYMKYDMIWYDMIWYDMIWYDMIWYDMIWYDMIWYDMIYDNEDQKLDSLRPGSREMERGRWEGQNFQLGSSAPGRRRMIYDTIYDMIYDMIWYDMIWYDMIWYDMIWYDMIWYDMIWYDMIWYALQLRKSKEILRVQIRNNKYNSLYTTFYEGGQVSYMFRQCKTNIFSLRK